MTDDTISRQAAIDALEEPCKVPDTWTDEYAVGERMQWEKDIKALNSLPSAQPEQRPLTEDNYVYCTECDPEVKCLSCGHHIAERPFEVYCNIMCKWVNEKDYCTMFEPGQEKMRKAEAEI